MSAAGMGDAAPSSRSTHNAIRLAIALPDRKPRAWLIARGSGPAIPRAAGISAR
jgi:hypothetical protein